MTPDRACGEPERSTQARNVYAALVVYGIALAAVYGSAMAPLWRDWTADANYSHGFFVVPIAAVLVWQRRHELRAAPVLPSTFGLAVIAASLAVFAVGTLAAEIFTTRASLIGVIAGTVIYTCGWSHLRIVAFPVSFLLFMIPLPAIVFDRATASLQLVASGLGADLLRLADVPVLRDGNILSLKNVTLNVTDACSGIRSLVSLLAFTSLAAYVTEPTAGRRTLLALSAIPLAILLNGLRVAATGLAATRF